FGGGSIRDLLLGHYPLTWVAHPEYLLLTTSAALLTIWIAPLMSRLRMLFLMLDALGLVAFTIIGVKVAQSMGLGMPVAVLAGLITGIFGGVIRDLLCNRVPLVFQKELYAVVSLGSACLFLVLQQMAWPAWLITLLTLAAGFTVRMLAIRYQWHLPRFEYNVPEK
ncbi:MAG: trimeric intracellular cation channel family protein, partial [Pseudomonadota bacterium]|nr:trimeric intracellular cation channel family protein [Pseudomonadota bacterium]